MAVLPVNGLYAVNDIRYFRDMFLKELNPQLHLCDVFRQEKFLV